MYVHSCITSSVRLKEELTSSDVAVNLVYGVVPSVAWIRFRFRLRQVQKSVSFNNGTAEQMEAHADAPLVPFSERHFRRKPLN